LAGRLAPSSDNTLMINVASPCFTFFTFIGLLLLMLCIDTTGFILNPQRLAAPRLVYCTVRL